MADDLKDRNELYHRCFKSDAGKAVLADMRRRASCEGTTFKKLPNGELDVKAMIAQEAVRTFVLLIGEWVKAAERPKPQRQRKALTATGPNGDAPNG